MHWREQRRRSREGTSFIMGMCFLALIVMAHSCTREPQPALVTKPIYIPYTSDELKIIAERTHTNAREYRR